MTQGRAELRQNPDIAIVRVKNVMDIVAQTPELYPSTRAELRHTIESSLLSFRGRKLEFDDRRELQQLAEANADALLETATRRARNEEEISILVNKFNGLVTEKNYDGALSVTREAFDLAENNPDVVVASESARVARNYYKTIELRRLKEEGFVDTMYEIEKVSIPFPGVNPLVFPDADEWKAKR